MTQNTSSAVMAQRVEAHDSLDYFPTPPWATRALCQFIGRQHTQHLTCWEPACGEGHMARPLAEYFHSVYASDVHGYGFGEVDDFLFPDPDSPQRFDWIITNPPFRLAMEFAHAAIERAAVGVALLVRLQFLEGAGRYNLLFSKSRPTWILQFTERVTMLKGRLYSPGTDDRSATAYCWLIWTKPVHNYETRFSWIAPCRAKLERPYDWRETVNGNTKTDNATAELSRPAATTPGDLGGDGSRSSPEPTSSDERQEPLGLGGGISGGPR